MTTIHTRATVGADGKVTVPVGTSESGRAVDVTVAPADELTTINGIPREEWFALLERTERSIDDEAFVRPAQTVYEHRLPFD